MVALAKNSDRLNPQQPRARFARQIPTSQRFEIQIRLQVYQRARYYDCNSGEFTSQDPLEYVDGMSLYRAYFSLSYMDPLGFCKDNGGRYQYIPNRGKFIRFEFDTLTEDKNLNPVEWLRSSFYGFWDPDESKFENKPCDCCSEIGTVQMFQMVKLNQHWQETPLVFEIFNRINEWTNFYQDWTLDGGYPYSPEDTIDPTTKQSLMHHDAPGDGFPLGGTLRGVYVKATEHLSQDFEFCVVCLKGLEKNAVYGCARWGHEFQLKDRFLVTKVNDYRIRRYINLVGSFKEYNEKGLENLAGRAPSATMKEIILRAQARN